MVLFALLTVGCLLAFVWLWVFVCVLFCLFVVCVLWLCGGNCVAAVLFVCLFCVCFVVGVCLFRLFIILFGCYWQFVYLIVTL